LQQGDPIEERYKESVNRGAVFDQLVRCINSYREAAVSNDPRFDHIDISEKQKVISSEIYEKKKTITTHVLTEN
jgi:heat shock protein 4